MYAATSDPRDQITHWWRCANRTVIETTRNGRHVLQCVGCGGFVEAVSEWAEFWDRPDGAA